MAPVEKRTKKATPDAISRELTIHMHKHIHGRSFKKRAPHAIKVIREFAVKEMKTGDVRIDPKLNKMVWGHGIKNVPHRIRVRLERKRNEDEEAKEPLYTVVTYVPVTSFKGLQTENVDA